MRFIVFLFLITFLGCKPEPKQQHDAMWFDLPNFVDGLVQNMDAKNHQAIRTFILNGEAETKQYESLDSIFWATELARLRDINLNSRQLKDALSMRSNIKDDKSNLLIDEYLLPDESIVPFKKLRIYYLGDTSEIRQVYAELKSSNLIAKSQTKITLWINRYNKKLLIDSLQIIGNDKTLMQPARKYTIATRTIL